MIMKTAGIRTQVLPGMLAGITLYFLASAVAAGIIETSWLVLIIPIVTVIMIAELYRKQDKPFDSLAHTFFPLIYTVFPFALFPFTAFSHSGLEPLIATEYLFSPGITVGFFILLWANDTGAYLVGITLGRHRLMERISPKKSWEGFAGGLLITILAALLLSSWLGVIERYGWIVIALIVSIAGTYGDLVESMLKRSHGVKDSGNIMPGHGGFLDRFDSVVLSFPLVYLYISLFG
jgi:phosphatidate cytidylyltransferase